MISPYARRLRLARDLRALREQSGLTADALSKRTGHNRTKISRLENAIRKPDVGDVMKILDFLQVPDGTWRALLQVARDAKEHGWWESREFSTMGERQALIADLETGAESIHDYQTTFIPGLLQTESFMRARAEVSRAHGDAAAGPGMRGRIERQRRFWDGGTRLEVLLEEAVVRRQVASASVMREQLGRLVEASKGDRVFLRVVPVDASMVDFPPPRSSFSQYQYPDPGDLLVTSVDTVTTDLILTEPSDVTPYQRLWNRLAGVALSPEDTVALLERAVSEHHRH